MSAPPRYIKPITASPIKTLTLVSAFYVLERAKFPKETYIRWLGNLINIMRMNPYLLLVLYTDRHSAQWIPLWVRDGTMPTIHVVIRELSEFHMYRFANHWRRNHEANHLLRMTTAWELNMLWSEKVWFLKGAHDAAVVKTPFYAWCDAGYFRDRSESEDLCTGGGLNYMQWARPARMAQLDSSKIYYSLINTDRGFLGRLKQLVANKDPTTRLPRVAIPDSQVSIGGGFCLLAPAMITNWCEEYTYKLEDYFHAGRLVKDDQIILADCIFSAATTHDSKSRFFLVNEGTGTTYDPWFVFQRFLM